MKMYKLFKAYNDYVTLLRTTDNTIIPMDEQNSDYQAYLKWLADGNTPLPAENE